MALGMTPAHVNDGDLAPKLMEKVAGKTKVNFSVSEFSPPTMYYQIYFFRPIKIYNKSSKFLISTLEHIKSSTLTLLVLVTTPLFHVL